MYEFDSRWLVALAPALAVAGALLLGRRGPDAEPRAPHRAAVARRLAAGGRQVPDIARHLSLAQDAVRSALKDQPVEDPKSGNSFRWPWSAGRKSSSATSAKSLWM